MKGLEDKEARIKIPNKKVIVLEDLDFTWNKPVIRQVINLWNSGVSLLDIAEEIKRNTEETFLLLMDLSRKGQIEQRKNYLWGTKN